MRHHRRKPFRLLEGPSVTVFISFAQQTQDKAYKDNAVAILPLAAMESHGPHLPVGTDALIAEGILDHAAARDKNAIEFVRLPTLWLGASAEHADRAGTLSQEPEPLVAQILAIGEGLARSGVRRVLLFNGHGGNVAAAAIAVLKLRNRFALLAASAHWLDFGLPANLNPPAPPAGDVHGGWIETSVLLHLAPSLVIKNAVAARPAKAPAVCLFPEGPLAWGWKLDDLATPGEGGWIGHPERATADLGQSLVNHAAERLLAVLTDLSTAPWPQVPR